MPLKPWKPRGGTCALACGGSCARQSLPPFPSSRSRSASASRPPPIRSSMTSSCATSACATGRRSCRSTVRRIPRELLMARVPRSAEQQKAFSSVCAWTWFQTSITGKLAGARIGRGRERQLLSDTGCRGRAGRLIQPDDDRPDAPEVRCCPITRGGCSSAPIPGWSAPNVHAAGRVFTVIGVAVRRSTARLDSGGSSRVCGFRSRRRRATAVRPETRSRES